MPSYDTLTELKAADLRGFDDDAKKLLAMMAMAKWRGYVSGSNHAIMHAPDGKTTVSVSRDSLRGRSGKNARAEFERWLKTETKEAIEVIKHVSQLEQSPFGNLARANKRTVTKGDWAWRDGAPVGLRGDAAVEVKRNEDVVEWMNSRTPAQRSAEGILLYNDENPLAWALFDTRGWPSLVGHGSATDPETSYTRYLELAPEDFPGTTIAPPDPEKETADVATLYQCPDCAKAWDTRSSLSAHRAAMHSDRTWTCPVCKREFKSAGAGSLHLAGHNRITCEVCGQDIVPHFMPRHIEMHNGTLTPKDVAPKRAPVGNALPRTRCEICGEPVPKKKMKTHIAEAHAPQPQAASAVVVSGDVSLTSGGELAQIRAIVAGPLLVENERLKARVGELEAQNERLVTEREDAKARMQLILEAAQA